MASDYAYGQAHRVARKEALRVLVDGTPCPFCGKPMNRFQSLDFDHVIPLILGGAPNGPKRLGHSSCNRKSGAAIGNRLRGKPAHRKVPVVRKRLPRW